MKKTLFPFLLLLLTFTCFPAQAGWFGGVLETALAGAGERMVENAVDDSADAVYEQTKESLTEENPAAEEKKPTRKTTKGKMAPAKVKGAKKTELSPVSASVKDDSSVGREKNRGSKDAGVIPGEEHYRRFDFLPGERVLFFDDFSGTAPGDFPARWTLQGPSGGGNTLEVATVDGRRFLRSRDVGKGNYQNGTRVYLRWKELRDLPQRFTIEFDAALLGDDADEIKSYGILLLGEEHSSPNSGMMSTLFISDRQAVSANTWTDLMVRETPLHHISVSVDGTAIKAFVDGEQVINDPEGVERPIRFVGISLDPESSANFERLMFTNFRLAEKGPGFAQALEKDGVIVAPGIRFDTGSDQLLPESVVSLAELLALLREKPALGFVIEGHTDDVGGPTVNGPLSRRRAEAVKGWLVAKGVAAERLTTKGAGEGKPVAANDTPEGRASNRRVEFVRK